MKKEVATSAANAERLVNLDCIMSGTITSLYALDKHSRRKRLSSFVRLDVDVVDCLGGLVVVNSD